MMMELGIDEVEQRAVRPDLGDSEMGRPASHPDRVVLKRRWVTVGRMGIVELYLNEVRSVGIWIRTSRRVADYEIGVKR